MVSTSGDSLSALLGIKPVRASADHENSHDRVRGSNRVSSSVPVAAVVTHERAPLKKGEPWLRKQVVTG
jgi:hypothetical protein